MSSSQDYSPTSPSTAPDPDLDKLPAVEAASTRSENNLSNSTRKSLVVTQPSLWIFSTNLLRILELASLIPLGSISDGW